MIHLDHLTDKQRREYAIRHNRSAEMSAWDFSKLEEELAQLAIDGVDMDDLDFTFPNDINVDDFFDQGVQTKEKTVVLGVKVLCENQQQVEELMDMLREAGYEPEEL